MEFIPNTEPERQYWFMDQLKSRIAEESIRAGRPLTYFIQTFGCQMNAKDSEKLAGVLESIGYKEAENENADSLKTVTHAIPDVVADEDHPDWPGSEARESDYFLEEVPAADSQEVDYWLGRHGSDRKVWIGESETMPLKQAKERAREMIRRWKNS